MNAVTGQSSSIAAPAPRLLVTVSLSSLGVPTESNLGGNPPPPITCERGRRRGTRQNRSDVPVTVATDPTTLDEAGPDEDEHAA